MNNKQIPQASATGFTSPADEYLERSLSLDSYLIKNPLATFFMRVSGNAMTSEGIYPQDLLIVDRSLTAKHGNIIIAILEGQLLLRKLHHKNGAVCLLADQSKFAINKETDFQVWGTVTYVIHQTK